MDIKEICEECIEDIQFDDIEGASHLSDLGLIFLSEDREPSDDLKEIIEERSS
jgi:hypothetical protein